MVYRMPVKSKRYAGQGFESLIKTPENLDDKMKGVIGPYKPLIKFIVYYTFGFVEESPEKIKKLQLLAHKSRVEDKWSDVMYTSRKLAKKIEADYEAME
jgi:hypothetical protein